MSLVWGAATMKRSANRFWRSTLDDESRARPATLEKLASLAKRRGFVFQSSEIYGGLASTWDYGPLGVLMKNNVKAAWWKAMVQERDDIVGIDAAILMHPRVWEASGHVAGFADPLVECKQCHTRFRPDHVSVWEVDNSEGSRLGYVTELNSQGTHAPKKKLSEVLPVEMWCFLSLPRSH